jgi:3-keto-5-aminohexanoate cleavage enzyme
MTWNTAPVVITVAPTGAEVTRADNPALPHTPAEIAADAAAAEAAGASVVHLHVREPDGTPSGRVELFEETVSRIRGDSRLITMVSTGGSVDMSIVERMTGLDAGPEMAGVETGSVNFGDDVFATSRPDCLSIIEHATARGVALEVEAFDVGHVVAAVTLHQQGRLPGALRVNLVFGVPGGIDASPEALAAMLRPLPPACAWTVTAVGRHQRRMLALGILNGATAIRVGLEDNVYRSRGILADSNAQLVADAVDLVRTLGRDVATPSEARELLGLSARPLTGAVR